MSIQSSNSIVIDNFVTKGGEESPWTLHIYAIGGKAVISLVWNGNVTNPANQTIEDLAEFKKRVADL